MHQWPFTPQLNNNKYVYTFSYSKGSQMETIMFFFYNKKSLSSEQNFSQVLKSLHQYFQWTGPNLNMGSALVLDAKKTC